MEEPIINIQKGYKVICPSCKAEIGVYYPSMSTESKSFVFFWKITKENKCVGSAHPFYEGSSSYLVKRLYCICYQCDTGFTWEI